MHGSTAAARPGQRISSSSVMATRVYGLGSTKPYVRNNSADPRLPYENNISSPLTISLSATISMLSLLRPLPLIVVQHSPNSSSRD